MNNFKVVSFFTQHTIYEEVAHTHLIPSLEKTNLDWQVDTVENRGDWFKNTGYKPTYIYFKLCECDKNIIWIDCDATIERAPVLLGEIPDDIDIAFHTLDWSKHYERPKETTTELLTGTIFFKNTIPVKEFVNKWAIECSKNPGIWEQKILERLLKQHPEFKIFNLPEEYCCILTFKNEIPSYIKEPVIVHHQASRNVRKHHI